MPRLKPRTPAPPLQVETLDGGTWILAAQDGWTLIEFYRGLHCPGCQGYLRDMERHVDEFRAIGVETIAISGDTRERAQKAKEQWGLDKLSLGYGLDVQTMEAWDLYISKGISDDEPEIFSEPGLYVVKPDGTIYYAAVNSMTFGRPRMSELLKALQIKIEHDDPARGEV